MVRTFVVSPRFVVALAPTLLMMEAVVFRVAEIRHELSTFALLAGVGVR